MKIIAWQIKPKRSFWFRIFGYGLNVIDRSVYPAPFSMRNGYRKEVRLSRWGLHVLTRSQINSTGAGQ